MFQMTSNTVTNAIEYVNPMLHVCVASFTQKIQSVD